MKTLLALALAGSALAAVPASAATYLFQLSGPTTATFQIDSSPTSNPTGKGFFSVSPVVGVYNGVAGVATIDFFDTTAADGLPGGMEIDFPAGMTSIFRRGGPVLFTGTLSAPTFKLGGFTFDATPEQKQQTLTISAIAPVPEVATWAMMVVGFGMIGGAARTRTRRTGISYS